MNYKYFSLILLTLVVFLVSCTSVPKEKVCTVDKDCVPVACCHATDSVNKDNAPDCRGQLCTMECVPNTLDCSQGKIKCVAGECTAVMNQ